MSNRMKLSKHTLIGDILKCPYYQSNELELTYKSCMGRQIAITSTPEREPLYPECFTCKDGKRIKAHFKNHTVNNPVNKTSFATFSIKKKKRAKRGTSPYTSHFQGKSKDVLNLKGIPIGESNASTTINAGVQGTVKPHTLDMKGASPLPATNNKLRILILAQANYIWDLAYKHRINESIERIKLLHDALIENQRICKENKIKHFFIKRYSPLK